MCCLQEGDAEDCVVCWAAARSAVCVPCGHLCLCSVCAKLVCSGNAQPGLCPVCRQQVGKTVTVWQC